MDKPAIRLSQALVGYMLAASARRLSKNTLVDYAGTYRRFQAHLQNDPPIRDVTAGDVRAFLNSLEHLSNKSLLNMHTGLSALWRWAVVEGLAERNVVREVDPPRPEIREIVPFSETDIRALVAACDRTRGYARPGKRVCDNARPSALRDRAILLLLLDTGLRATELCELHLYQVDLKNAHILVEGKGNKERMIPISARTGQSLWKYLASRSDPPTVRADSAGKAGFVFVSREGRPLDRQSLRHLLERIGQRAGVQDVHPHRFRHTFAILYLRNRGDVYTLQRILGHTTMEMVKRYLAIAEVDVQAAHKAASPVANLLL